MGFLDALFADPTNPLGSPIARWLGLNPGTASTSTPTLPAPPVGQGTSSTNPVTTPSASGTNWMQFFQPRTGLLGNSIIGDALRGGFAGLAGSNGYTGLGALGAGFGTGHDFSTARARNQAGTALAGQQYQGQQQALAQGNMQIAQAVAQYNIWDQAFNGGRGQITVQDAMSDPQKLAQIMSAVGGPIGGQQSGQQSAVGGPVGGAIPSMLNNPNGPQAGGAAYQAATIPQGGSGPRQSYLDNGLAAATAQIESGNGASSDNLYQFKGDTAAKYGYHSGMTADEQRQAFNQLTGDNKMALTQALGQAPTDAQLYLAHQQGAAGAAALIQSPDKNAAAVLAPFYGNNAGKAMAAIVGNGGTPGMTAGDFVNLWQQKYQQVAGNAVSGSQGDAGGVGQSGQQGSTQVAQAGPQGDAANYMAQVFAETHMGMSPSQWAMLGRRLQAAGNPQGAQMVAEALKYDPGLLYAQKALETQAQMANTPQQERPGTMTTIMGQPIGRGTPTLKEMFNPKTGDYEWANVYPNNDVEFLNGDATSKPGPYGSTLGEGFAKRRLDIGSAVDAGITAEQRLDAMADAFKLTPSGTFADIKAEGKAALKAAGIELPDDVWGNPAAVQQVFHDNVLAAFGMVKPMIGTGSRVAAAEVQRLVDALPNIGLQPEANLKILAQLKGVVQYQRAFYDALAKQKGPVDPDAFEIQFNRDHPIGQYVADAEKAIGPLNGMAGGPGGVPAATGDLDAGAKQYPQTSPAIAPQGAGATLAWFKNLPMGAWFKNPYDGKILQKGANP